MLHPSCTLTATLVLLLAAGPRLLAADLDAEPIRYSSATPANAVWRLQEDLAAGKASLRHDKRHGYLRDLLKALQVPESSQVLVFSKTSLQRHRISPVRPRAIYFNDDVYVGFCQNGDVIELSAADPNLGTVFSTLDQKKTDRAVITRQGEACLLCHGSSQNEGLPGHLVRSVYPDARGLPVLSAGSHRTDHTSPLRERWGGWYVTGTSGTQTHLGNLTVAERTRPEEVDNRAGVNVTDLGRYFKTGLYLTPHSDLVALMVLEHQTAAHNRLTRANFLTRLALHDEAELNKALGRTMPGHSESTVGRIQNAGEPLLKYLLFGEEAPLSGPVQGTSGFAEAFARRGPFDKQGRSLRDFDLRRRMFKYPCSYLIYSAAFDGLPAEVKDYVYRRLWEVLTGKDTGKDFAHLSTADRLAVREILLETKANLPDYWRK
jgi:hypothetical protein